MRFKIALLCFAVCLPSTIVLAQPPVIVTPAQNHPTPQPFVPPQEPESYYKALNEFVAALNKKDWQVAARRVVGSKKAEEWRPAIQELKAAYGHWRLQVEQTDLQDAEENFVALKIRLCLTDPMGNRISHEERLIFQNDKDLWKIVPLTADSANRAYKGTLDSNILQNIATCFSTPQFISQRKANQCMNNLKQLGLAATQFVQDWDEKFALKANAFGDYLRPYFGDEDILSCPLHPDDKTSYSFNAKLENANLAQIKQPSQTVMIYEGQDGKLDFRHENRAGICFADGHVKMLTPDEAKTLRWEL